MSQIIDGLLPRPAGIAVQERRLVTLTKEGGIGKTAIALEVSDWAWEREFFPGGVFEVSCERFLNAQELMSHLLALFGVPLGVLASRQAGLRTAITGAVGILQTIPSLAMLALLLTLTGRI